jgi:hypothetical protein
MRETLSKKENKNRNATNANKRPKSMATKFQIDSSIPRGQIEKVNDV